MNIDLRTLALILSLAYGLQAIILFLQYWIAKTYPGMGRLGLGFASIALGFFFLLLREMFTPEGIFIFLGNVLLVLGSVIIYTGILRFLNLKEDLRLLFVFLAVFGGLFFFFTFWQHEMKIRSIILFLTIAIILMRSGHALVANKNQPILGSASFVSGVFFIIGGLAFARGITVPFIDPPQSIFSLTAIQVGVFLTPLVGGVGLTFGFILMINQRLNGEIRDAKEDVEIIFNTSPDASLIVRLKDRIIINMNDKFTALTGFTREEIIGKSSLDLRIWKNPEDRHRVAEIMNQKGFCENVEVEFLRKDFRPLVGMISAKVVQLQKIPHIVTFTRDITDRKQAEEALRASEARYRAVAYSASDAIISANSLGTIVNWNRGAEHMFGYTVVEVSGQSVSKLMPERYRDLHLAGMNRMRAGENSRIVGKTLELEGLHKDGSEFPIELSLSQWETGEGRFYTAIIRDTTERRHYQDRLEYFASHDSLTSLLNRHALEEHLSRMIAKARRGGKGCLLYMDLDNFKDVNDSVGHSAGDEILIHLTNRFKAELRTEDIIFRLGGDEFAVLFDGVELEEAWPAAERLCRSVESHPFEAGGRIFALSLSSGLIQVDGKLEPGPLLSQADTAMYQAKAQGKNQVVTYQKED